MMDADDPFLALNTAPTPQDKPQSTAPDAPVPQDTKDVQSAPTPALESVTTTAEPASATADAAALAAGDASRAPSSPALSPAPAASMTSSFRWGRFGRFASMVDTIKKQSAVVAEVTRRDLKEFATTVTGESQQAMTALSTALAATASRAPPTTALKDLVQTVGTDLTAKLQSTAATVQTVGTDLTSKLQSTAATVGTDLTAKLQSTAQTVSTKAQAVQQQARTVTFDDLQQRVQNAKLVSDLKATLQPDKIVHEIKAWSRDMAHDLTSAPANPNAAAVLVGDLDMVLALPVADTEGAAKATTTSAAIPARVRNQLELAATYLTDPVTPTHPNLALYAGNGTAGAPSVPSALLVEQFAAFSESFDLAAWQRDCDAVAAQVSAVQQWHEKLVPTEVSNNVFWLRMLWKFEENKTIEQAVQDAMTKDDDFSWEAVAEESAQEDEEVQLVKPAIDEQPQAAATPLPSTPAEPATAADEKTQAPNPTATAAKPDAGSDTDGWGDWE
ncbi:hypothetical protein AMAG_13373 [Allomyces macrogynus ATCC 38327]|uniref:BSD domain-containing protein n=1 Tax=Allomyces macrogynus (strain ATCC 38327) TaxID=578462 RepID=A0A0L0T1V2_ALLM3|nr:hypothetical protein AMAG_13373 [Allomyces macrogynus ATCC 38327]|eukprot:KNE68731.1 hypothetical protein AMAG_13373 [Allomyces macrogynus ATCC 38327]